MSSKHARSKHNKSNGSSHKSNNGRRESRRHHSFWHSLFGRKKYLRWDDRDPDVQLYEEMELLLMESKYTLGNIIARVWGPCLVAMLQYTFIGYTLTDLYFNNLDPTAVIWLQMVLITASYLVLGMFSPDTPFTLWRMLIVPIYAMLKTWKFNATRGQKHWWLIVMIFVHTFFQFASHFLGGYAGLEIVDWFTGSSHDIGQPVFRTTSTNPAGTHSLLQCMLFLALVVLAQTASYWFIFYYDHQSIRTDPTFHDVQDIEGTEEQRIIIVDAIWNGVTYGWIGPLIGSVTDPIFILSTAAVGGGSTDASNVIAATFIGWGIGSALGILGHLGLFALVDEWQQAPLRFDRGADGRPLRDKDGALIVSSSTSGRSKKVSTEDDDDNSSSSNNNNEDNGGGDDDESDDE